MQFMEHTNQQRILRVVAQLLYGQLTLRNFRQHEYVIDLSPDISKVQVGDLYYYLE